MSKKKLLEYSAEAQALRYGIYQHYSGKNYKLIGIARHSETLEELVVYQQLYGNNDLWVRPLKMFCETVEISNKLTPRFAYIGDSI